MCQQLHSRLLKSPTILAYQRPTLYYAYVKDFKNLEETVLEKAKGLGGQVSLYVKFLNSEEIIKLNEKTQYWAAGLIMLPVVCEVYRFAKEKGFDLNKKVKIKSVNSVRGSGVIKLLDSGDEFTVLDLINLTIDLNDNTAMNELVDIIGWESVDRYMKKLGLHNTTYRHKLMITENRGPNLTTAEDVASLLEMLYSGTVAGAKKIVDIMKEQQDRAKIPLLLPNEIETATKSGSLEKAMHDVGIVFSAKNPFIFAFLADDQENKRATNNVLSESVKLCYDYSLL